MSETGESTFFDRVGLILFGGATGAAYGIVLALLMVVFLDQFHPAIIGWSALVFAVLGFFYGNFVAEAFLALAHLTWGFLNGFADNWTPPDDAPPQGHLRAFFLVGLGTGIALGLWWIGRRWA